MAYKGLQNINCFSQFACIRSTQKSTIVAKMPPRVSAKLTDRPLAATLLPGVAKETEQVHEERQHKERQKQKHYTGLT